jgi:hypothetical protein
MGVCNPRYEELLRLESKTLDAQFLTTVQQGLSCSPFESHAVLEVVKEVYFPFLAQAQTSMPLPGGSHWLPCVLTNQPVSQLPNVKSGLFA